MPKLGHPYLTKGKAIAYLLDLYRNDSEFVKELDEIRRPYMPLLFDLARAILSFSAESKKALTSQDYLTLVAYFQGKSQQAPNIPIEVEEQKERMKQLGDKLQPYATALGKFAFKWKLRAPWAVQTLISYDIFDFATAMGLPTQVDVRLGCLDGLYPWPPPTQRLEIDVSAYDLILFGRREVQAEIARRLEEYEKEIKATNLGEAPSALERHARWWFAHHVNGRSYAELADEDHRFYEETIKRAVWNLSKLIGINVQR